MRSLQISCFAFLLGSLPFGATLHAQDAQWRPDLHWRLVGPFRGGRTRAATGVPDQPTQSIGAIAVARIAAESKKVLEK